jgi:plasmid stability protein
MISITIKGIPKETHRKLKKRAAAHRRSLNSEVIYVLESTLCGGLDDAGLTQQVQRSVKKSARRK